MINQYFYSQVTPVSESWVQWKQAQHFVIHEEKLCIDVLKLSIATTSQGTKGYFINYPGRFENEAIICFLIFCVMSHHIMQ